MGSSTTEWHFAFLTIHLFIFLKVNEHLLCAKFSETYSLHSGFTLRVMGRENGKQMNKIQLVMRKGWHRAWGSKATSLGRGVEPGAEAAMSGGNVLVKVPGRVCQAEGTASAKAPKNRRSLVHSRQRKTDVGACSERCACVHA